MMRFFLSTCLLFTVNKSEYFLLFHQYRNLKKIIIIKSTIRIGIYCFRNVFILLLIDASFNEWHYCPGIPKTCHKISYQISFLKIVSLCCIIGVDLQKWDLMETFFCWYIQYVSICVWNHRAPTDPHRNTLPWLRGLLLINIRARYGDGCLI